MNDIRITPGISEEAMTRVVEWTNARGEAFMMQYAGNLWTFPLTIAQIAAETAPYYTITRDGRFAGMIQVMFVKDHNAHVGRFILDPEQTGHGVGTQALNAVCAMLFEDPDIASVTLCVYAFNEPALRCYKRCGFEIVEELHREHQPLCYRMKRVRSTAPEITIRPATPDDAAAVLAYMKLIGGESDNLTFGEEGLPFTVEQERRFLENLRDDPRRLFLTAWSGDTLVATASFDCSNRPRLAHRGEISLSVLRAYWGRHIGSRLTEALIRHARDTAHVEILSLAVRSDNARAISLYRKYGFVNIGHFPGYLKIDDALIDCELMNLYL